MINRKQLKKQKRKNAVRKAANIKRSKAVPNKVKKRNEKVERRTVRQEMSAMFSAEIQKQREIFNAETIDAEVVP